ncbi:hypothetical protein G6N05_08030 [Flavobacterium sp. F372]|jgi:hypothetical protein|uniref:DUF4468 domain-containing protein n=1 Tax=Flavobacterium bernardetii TaxID=2813823 RepID=A0ABR7IWZ4_9FLAO|nr:hypothetical protein [Flavobacterium bernardetii]MBC5834306.1 hypothetical protein [Flavobacterium bernardetii]NHF70055.1 hypothetical protein [Flavobacterium bernardetii]
MNFQKILIVITLLTVSQNCFSNEKLSKDLDNDNIKDQIIFDKKNAQIICKLSTQNFLPIRSQKLEYLNDTAGIQSTKNGFQFYNHSMRLGYYCQFRYNPTEKKIELIGMSRYNLGNVMQDGSGESSVNLLTKKYIGEWIRFNEKAQKHVKLPTIYKPYNIDKVYLEGFSVKQPDDFVAFCDNLRNKIVYK